MAQVIRHVDPDASGAANGTSWTDAYTALETALSTEAKDISAGGSGEQFTFYCRSSGGTADTTAVDMVGWTTDATNYIEVIGIDFPLDGVFDTTKYNLFQDSTSAWALHIQENYVRIENLQIRVTTSGAGSARGTQTIAVGASDVRYTNVIVRGTCAGTGDGRGFAHSDGSITHVCCIAYGFFSADELNNNWSGFSQTNAGTVGKYWNCIAYGNYIGFREGVGIPTTDIVNCVSGNNANDFEGTLTIDNCCSDDGDGTNAQGPLDGDWTKEFTDPANGDFSNVKGGNCIDNGTDDPGSGLYSDDIIGTAFSSPWDIGAFEFVAAVDGSALLLGSNF